MSEEAKSRISRYLQSRGSRVVQIERRLFDLKLILGRGLSNLAGAYEVTSELPDGTIRKQVFAYDPAGGMVGKASGLKRYANGVWFDIS